MIVQSAPEGRPHFVIMMAQHTAFAGQLARAFGNDRFEPVSPRDEMLYVIEHHDDGWREWDTAPGLDPATRLPYNLVETPRPDILETGKRSPEVNEAHHPYCGLISSMHIWGLYNGRYGYSDKVLIEGVPAEHRPRFDEMLDGQLARQERLKARLSEDPETAAWVEEPHLFQNYKQLQFFDTLALYFNCTHEAARTESAFGHVPMTATEDVTVTVRPLEEGVYGVSPFPFAEDGVEVGFEGCYISPFPEGVSPDLPAVLAGAPAGRQSARLVAM